MKDTLLVIIATAIVCYVLLKYKESRDRKRYLPVGESMRSEQYNYVIKELSLLKARLLDEQMYGKVVQIDSLLLKLRSNSIGEKEIYLINKLLGEYHYYLNISI